MCPELHSVTSQSGNSSSTSGIKVSEKRGLIDQTFDPAKSNSYHLSIELSLNSIVFCVLDTLNNKYIALDQEEISNKDIGNAGESLLELLKTHVLLEPTYKSSSLLVVTDQFTTVPTPVYEKSKERIFLGFNIEGNTEDVNGVEVMTDKLQSIDAYNIYGLPKAMVAALQQSLSDLMIIHHTSSLIETLLNLNKNQNRKTCFVHVQKGLFSILVIDGNDLIFCNNFLFSSKEDLAYYTLFVFEQLKLNPESVDTVLLGEFGNNAPEYAILYSYIRNLRFIDRNQGFEYSYVMDNIPAHHHFNLFNQYHCVS